MACTRRPVPPAHRCMSGCYEFYWIERIRQPRLSGARLAFSIITHGLTIMAAHPVSHTPISPDPRTHERRSTSRHCTAITLSLPFRLDANATLATLFHYSSPSVRKIPDQPAQS